MAENLGAIRYDIEIETASMLKAEAAVNKSIANQVTAFDKADKAVREFEATQKSLGRTINSMGQVMSANGKIVATATQQYRGLAGSASSGFTALNTQINKTNQAVKSAMPNMTNMSYQIQDIAVQAQMGTSPFVIFAQQFPQMAVGMGAAAGAIGAVVAILGAMGTALIDTTTSMKKLEKSIERVQAVITIGSNGVANYSEEMQKLSAISEVLTKIKLQNALAEQNAALKESASAMRDVWKEAGTLFDQTSSGVISEVISDKDQKKLKSLSADFNAGKISLEEFNTEAGHIKNAMSGISLIDEGIKNLGFSSKEAKERGLEQLINGLELFSTSAGQNTKQGRDLSSTITDLVQKYKEGKLTLDALNNSLNGVTKDFDRNASTIKDLTNEFVINAIRLQEGERAALKFGLQLKGLDSDQIAAQMSLFDYNKELENTAEAAKQAAKIKSKSIDDEINGYIKLAEQVVKTENAKKTKKIESATTFTQRVINKGKTESELFAEEQQKLFDLRSDGLISQQMYDDAVVASVENRNAQIEASNKRQMQSQALFNDSQGQLMSSLGNLFGDFAASMEAQDKESFEKKKKFQLAQALINTAMAISNALAAAPPPINFALAGIAGAAGALQVSAIQGQQFSGGRQYGGPVSQGMYRVNETGTPEIYSQGGKDYLMNTKNANITPLDKAGGGSQMPQIIVNNNSPEKAYVTYDEAANIANVQIGREAKKASQGRGSLYNGLSKGTNVKNNARR